MAIKILKKGQTKFVGECYRCGCRFSYELSDLERDNHVDCPCCGYAYYHLTSSAPDSVPDPSVSPNPPGITPIPDFPTLPPNYPSPYWPNIIWTTATGCDDCPVKKNFDSSKGYQFGDSPCDRCPKRQPYCGGHTSSDLVSWPPGTTITLTNACAGAEQQSIYATSTGKIADTELVYKPEDIDLPL